MEARVVYKVDEEDLKLINQYSWYMTDTGYWATRAKQDITGKGGSCGV